MRWDFADLDRGSEPASSVVELFCFGGGQGITQCIPEACQDLRLTGFWH